jgi:hypothetical protein
MGEWRGSGGEVAGKWRGSGGEGVVGILYRGSRNYLCGNFVYNVIGKGILFGFFRNPGGMCLSICIS